MSESENHHHGKNEVIIVKRRSGGSHEGAHGGAWKIAYADFMTAMMAFFLVMWLVNAANEETKASVASYFNPIKLSDEKPAIKGFDRAVNEAEGVESNERSKIKAENATVGSSAATGEDQTTQSGEEANYSEADFFENPYSVLAEIAQEVGQQANVSAKGEGGAANSGPATGANGGEAYRDPFDPDFWTQQVKVTRTDQQEPPAPAGTKDEIISQDDAKEEAAQTTLASVDPSKTKPDLISEVASLSDKKPDQTIAATALQKAAAAEDADVPHQPTAAEARAASDLREQIEKEIGGVSGKLAEGLIVTAAEGGILVTISDQSEAPMFNVGSAVPRKEMVLAMEKIGHLLQGRGGDIVVRGHTDGRQFRGGVNDNWRLSMDRAHSAYYMLVRGGLEENRVKQVSGFADRRLQIADDPLADANRRIEILLQAEHG